MDKKALIFDLDGTLVDTVSDIAGAVNEMLRHYGFDLHSVDDIRKMIGKGAKDLITQALPSNSRTPDFINEALEYYRGCYDRALIVDTRVYDGLKKVLEELKKENVKMAVLSNKDDRHVKAIVEALMPDTFLMANGFSPCYPHKPAPDSVIAMMEDMGVTKEETAYIGDSSVDVLTAKNAGLLSVGVAWGLGGIESFSEHRPDVLIKEPKQLLEL